MPQEKPTQCTPGRSLMVDFHHLTPRQADWMNCLLSGAMAALPCFLEAFVSCLAGGSTPGADDYSPGNRNRC